MVSPPPSGFLGFIQNLNSYIHFKPLQILSHRWTPMHISPYNWTLRYDLFWGNRSICVLSHRQHDSSRTLPTGVRLSGLSEPAEAAEAAEDGVLRVTTPSRWPLLFRATACTRRPFDSSATGALRRGLGFVILPHGEINVGLCYTFTTPAWHQMPFMWRTHKWRTRESIANGLRHRVEIN